MKKYFGSVLVLAMVLMASTGFACNPQTGVGCVSVTDYSATTTFNSVPANDYGVTNGYATTVRGGTANAGSTGWGKSTALIGGSSLDTTYGKTGGFGNGTSTSGSYGISTSIASGVEAGAAGRFLGNPSVKTYVNVSGQAIQSNGSFTGDMGQGTSAAGNNTSQANFSSNKTDNSRGNILGYTAAGTVNAGEATATGGTLMTAGYTAGKSAYAGGITGSTSQASPNGKTTGSGSMSTLAQVHDVNGSGGFTQTSGNYCYDAPTKGAGFTAGGGAVKILNGPNTSTVMSVSGQISVAK